MEKLIANTQPAGMAPSWAYARVRVFGGNLPFRRAETFTGACER